MLKQRLAYFALGVVFVLGLVIGIGFRRLAGWSGPAPDAELDDHLTQVVERNTGFLRSFNKDLEQTARQNAIDDIRRAARSSGILKDAEERARAQLTHLCRQLGFEDVEFSKH